MLTTLVAGAFVVGVVVFVHELGHFLVGKLVGVYIETFSIGFGKKILKRKAGETEYAISALPFGGYVKFAGESETGEPEGGRIAAGEGVGSPADVAGAAAEIDKTIPPDRYLTAKPRPARAAILFAGPFMNYVLAVALYIGVYFFQGFAVYPSTILGGVADSSAAKAAGLVAGDTIVSIEGSPVGNWGDLLDALESAGTSPAVFEIGAPEGRKAVKIRPGSKNERPYWGIQPFVSSEIGRVKRDKPAYRAGIREGAVVTAIDGVEIRDWEALQSRINETPEKPLLVEWTREGCAYRDTIVPDPIKALKPGTTDQYEVVGVVGIEPNYVRRREEFVSSVRSGFAAANGMAAKIVGYLGLLISGRMGVDSLGGPIMVTQMAGDVARWGFDYLLVFLAFFSINLCIFNLMPLLPFDGGHLAILLFESIARRPLNRRVRDIFAQAGFVLIILLMVFVVFLDLHRCSGSSPGMF